MGFRWVDDSNITTCSRQECTNVEITHILYKHNPWHKHTACVSWRTNPHSLLVSLFFLCRFSRTVRLTICAGDWILSHLNGPVWSSAPLFFSACPFKYSWLVAFGASLTLSCHVILPHPVESFPPFWFMAHIHVFSEASRCKCNLYSSSGKIAPQSFFWSKLLKCNVCDKLTHQVCLVY